jgi:hypothetical protein
MDAESQIAAAVATIRGSNGPAIRRMAARPARAGHQSPVGHKMDKPSASLVRLMGVALSAILGLFGLVSPEKSAEVLKLLLQ